MDGATNFQTTKLSERKSVWRLRCISVPKLQIREYYQGNTEMMGVF